MKEKKKKLKQIERNKENVKVLVMNIKMAQGSQRSFILLPRVWVRYS